MHYKDPGGRIPCHQASPRVYEAMACDALLLVDAQKDVMSLFKDREDLVVFRSVDELRRLLAYYLEQAEERRSIAESGRRKVFEKHTYKHRIEYLLKVVAQ